MGGVCPIPVKNEFSSTVVFYIAWCGSDEVLVFVNGDEVGDPSSFYANAARSFEKR